MGNLKKKIKDAEIVFINSPNQHERDDLHRQASSIASMYEIFLVILCLEVLTEVVLYCRYAAGYETNGIAFVLLLLGTFTAIGVQYFIFELIRQSMYPLEEKEIQDIFKRCNIKNQYLDFCRKHHDVEAVLNEQGLLILKGYTRSGIKDEIKLDMSPSKCRGSKDVVIVTYNIKTGELKYPVR